LSASCTSLKRSSVSACERVRGKPSSSTPPSPRARPAARRCCSSCRPHTPHAQAPGVSSSPLLPVGLAPLAGRARPSCHLYTLKQHLRLEYTVPARPAQLQSRGQRGRLAPPGSSSPAAGPPGSPAAPPARAVATASGAALLSPTAAGARALDCRPRGRRLRRHLRVACVSPAGRRAMRAATRAARAPTCICTAPRQPRSTTLAPRPGATCTRALTPTRTARPSATASRQRAPARAGRLVHARRAGAAAGGARHAKTH